MKFAAIITSALIVFSATTSMASGCNKGNYSGRFKNTVPPVKSVAVQTVKSTSASGVR